MNKIVVGKNVGIRTERAMNVAVIGEIGSGKTTNFLVPNLLDDQPDSNIVFVGTSDETELMEKMKAVYASRGYAVKMLDLTGGDSDSYNPFDYLAGEIDINHFVDVILSSEHEFEDISLEDISSALKIVITDVLTQAAVFPRNLHGVSAYLEDIIETKSVKGVEISDDRVIVYERALDVLDELLTENTQGILEVDEMDFQDLTMKPMVVIVKHEKYDKNSAHLANIFLAQILYSLKLTCSGPRYVNVIIHDFPMLGRVHDFEEYLEHTIRNVNIVYILQTILQLDTVYGDHNKLLNHSNVLFYKTNEQKTLEEVARRNLGVFSVNDLKLQPNDECLYVGLNGELLRMKKY